MGGEKKKGRLERFPVAHLPSRARGVPKVDVCWDLTGSGVVWYNIKRWLTTKLGSIRVRLARVGHMLLYRRLDGCGAAR